MQMCIGGGVISLCEIIYDISLIFAGAKVILFFKKLTDIEKTNIRLHYPIIFLSTPNYPENFSINFNEVNS
jgi:hypothetical protein